MSMHRSDREQDDLRIELQPTSMHPMITKTQPMFRNAIVYFTPLSLLGLTGLISLMSLPCLAQEASEPSQHQQFHW